MRAQNMGVRILGNVERCRTEAEIFDESEKTVAVLYESSDGWHAEIVDDSIRNSESAFAATVERAKETLSHYVNRRGHNAPEDATVGVLALWLMVKDDGTALGKKLE